MEGWPSRPKPRFRGDQDAATGRTATNRMNQKPVPKTSGNCPSCGTSRFALARFCPGCGTPVSQEAATLEPGLLRLDSSYSLAQAPRFPLQVWRGHLVVVGHRGRIQVFVEGQNEPVVQEEVSLEGDLASPPVFLEGLLAVPGPQTIQVHDLASRLSGRSFEPPRPQGLPLGGSLVSAVVSDGRRWLAAPVSVENQAEVRLWEYCPRRGFVPHPSFRPGGVAPGEALYAWLVGHCLYAGPEGGVLSGLELATRQTLPTLQVSGSLKASPVVRDGAIPLVRSAEDALFRLPASPEHSLQFVFQDAGQSLWTWAEDPMAWWVAAGGHLYRGEPQAGGQVRLALRDSGALCPAPVPGGAFVLDRGGWLTAVSFRDGQLEHAGQQRLFEGSIGHSGAPVVLGQTLYVVDPEGRLGAWRALEGGTR